MTVPPLVSHDRQPGWDRRGRQIGQPVCAVPDRGWTEPLDRFRAQDHSGGSPLSCLARLLVRPLTGTCRRPALRTVGASRLIGGSRSAHSGHRNRSVSKAKTRCSPGWIGDWSAIIRQARVHQ